MGSPFGFRDIDVMDQLSLINIALCISGVLLIGELNQMHVVISIAPIVIAIVTVMISNVSGIDSST